MGKHPAILHDVILTSPCEALFKAPPNTKHRLVRCLTSRWFLDFRFNRGFWPWMAHRFGLISLAANPRCARACEGAARLRRGLNGPVGGFATSAADSQSLMKPQPDERTLVSVRTKRDCASSGQAAPRRPEHSEDTP